MKKLESLVSVKPSEDRGGQCPRTGGGKLGARRARKVDFNSITELFDSHEARRVALHSGMLCIYLVLRRETL